MVDKLPKVKSIKTPAVPFSISILKKCIDHGIDASLIKHLHLYDLQCLIFQFEIDRIKEYLRQKEQEELHKQGISEVKNISGNEALKFLGR